SGGPARPLRILLIEDHADTAQTMARLLKGEGHEVTVAETKAAALSHRGDAIDLVISDIQLPDGSGIEVLRHLSTNGPLPAIALSGFGSEEDLRRSREAGFRQHLTKPIDFSKLLVAIGDVTAPPSRSE